MNRRMRGLLSIALTLPALLIGCVRETDSNTQPPDPEPPGTLVSVTYGHTVGMVRGADFEVSVTPEEITWMRYFVMEELEYAEVQNVPIDIAYWETIEASALVLFPKLQERIPVQQKQSLWEKLFGPKELPMVLDGGDETTFSLSWETAEGRITVPYGWDSSLEGAMELVDALKSLTQTIQ